MLMHEKNMCDPYSGLSILLYGVKSLPDMTSCDKERLSSTDNRCRQVGTRSDRIGVHYI